MSMEVKRIRDLIYNDQITVINKSKGFTIRDLAEGYQKDSDDGYSTDSVYGYNGKLNIRPSYQRNSVYNASKRDAVMDTILNECPLNTTYWVDNEDGTYEVLDGQQRILYICKYISGEFSVSSDKFPTKFPQDFQNLRINMNDIAEKILDYELDIYVCKGTPAEKPEALLSGSWNRQDYLETALKWAALHEKYTDSNMIEEYMLKHCNDKDASELWQHFSCVVEWIRSKFGTYNSALKGMDWGNIYELYINGKLNDNIISKSGQEIHDEIIKLLQDEEVTAKMKGIYQYIIYGDEKHLQIRTFDEKTASIVYEKQNHKCPYCEKEGNNKEYALKEMHADILNWKWSQETCNSK